MDQAKKHYGNWLTWWIKYAKPKIKSFFLWKTKMHYKEYNQTHDRLQSRLNESYSKLVNNPDEKITINRLKAEMLTLQRKLTQNFIKENNNYIAGEPMSTFHLFKRRKNRNFIQKLRLNNRTLENEKEILDAIQEQFKLLFSGNDNCLNSTPIIPRKIPEACVLNNDLTKEIEIVEIFHTIRTATTNRSPGLDGLPYEFYETFFDIIHKELNLIINEALDNDIPPEFVEGIIVLIPKDNNTFEIENWRPITLLNADYKIFSRILKFRMKNILDTHNILTSSQKCGNGKNNIFQALLSIKDRIMNLKEKKIAGKLISFDMEKAFDRVDHTYLYKTLTAIGFKENFITLIK